MALHGHTPAQRKAIRRKRPLPRQAAPKARARSRTRRRAR